MVVLQQVRVHTDCQVVLSPVYEFMPSIPAAQKFSYLVQDGHECGGTTITGRRHRPKTTMIDGEGQGPAGRGSGSGRGVESIRMRGYIEYCTS